jgi:hypothetical protein
MIGNARQHIAQVSLGIDAEHFAGLQDREHRGGTITPGIGAQEDKILPCMRIFAYKELCKVADYAQSCAKFPADQPFSKAADCA